MMHNETQVHESEVGAVFLKETGAANLPFVFTTHAKIPEGGFVTLSAYSLVDLRSAFDRFHPEKEFQPEYDPKTRVLFLMKGKQRVQSWFAARDLTGQCHAVLHSLAGRTSANFEVQDLHGAIETLTVRKTR